MANQQQADDQAALAGVPLIPERTAPMEELPDEVEGYSEMFLLDLGIRSKGNKLVVFASGSDTAIGNKFKVKKIGLDHKTTFKDLERKALELIGTGGELVDFENKGPNNHGKIPTAMSFNFRRDCFLLIRVNQVATNLRFSKDYHAFTREDKGTDVYCPLKWPGRIYGLEARKDGSFDGELRRDGKGGGEGCVVALFAYDYRGPSYVHERYNIYLDVVDGDVGDAAAPYIPIIVDPDVRYPGGNQGP